MATRPFCTDTHPQIQVDKLHLTLAHLIDKPEQILHSHKVMLE
jgi:hypothetical protein